MSSTKNVLSEEQLLCSICLDVFTDPVTIPCGHNFCKNCITEHWGLSVHSECPVCKDVFDRRPELRVNTFISELASHFRHSDVQMDSSCSVQQYASTGKVLCGVCTETKLKAMKSCLVCLTSYCETHLELHQKITGPTRHELIDPVENLKDRMCKKHNRPLQLFCKTDQVCVCLVCTESDHKLHRIVPLMEEYHQMKAELGKTDAEIQLMIQERRLKIQELKYSVELSREDADRETSGSVQVFTALVQCVERGLAQLVDTIQEKQKRLEKQAEAFVAELEEEISELTKRRAQVEQLSFSEDHLQLIQSFSSMDAAPPAKDWTDVRVQASYEGIMRRAVAQLQETVSKEMKKVTETELKRVQKFTADVTLDPKTAHATLYVSKDGKQVHCSLFWATEDNPEKFTACACVLAKQSLSSGKLYYEVQVNGKTNWSLGVATESINRKTDIIKSPNQSLWAIWFKDGRESRAPPGPGASCSAQRQKVGVFVDYEEGLVTFYDADDGSLIYEYTGCKFTEKLHPIFGPCDVGGKRSSPLIISPVHITH